MDPFYFIFAAITLTTGLYTYYKKIKIKKNLKDIVNIFQKIINKYPQFKQKTNAQNDFPILYGKFENIDFACTITNDFDQNSRSGFLTCIKTKHYAKNNHVFSIKKEDLTSKFIDSVSRGDIKSGDKLFDDKMQIVSTNYVSTISMLDYDFRHNLLFLEKESIIFRLNENELFLSYDFNKINNSKKLIDILKKMTSISNLIKEKHNLKEKIINNIKIEKIQNALYKNLQIFTSLPNLENEDKIILKSLLKNNDIEIQIEAASKLNNEGMEHLVQILNNIKITDLNLIFKIIKLLRNEQYKKSIPILKKYFTNTHNQKMKIEIIKTFEIFGDTKLSLFLVEKLHNAEIDLQLSIVKALASCGDKDSVEQLYRLRKKSLSPVLRNSIQKTLKQIKSRLGKIGAGWLSIHNISEKEGGLSMPNEAGTGALSEPEDE